MCGVLVLVGYGVLLFVVWCLLFVGVLVVNVLVVVCCFVFWCSTSVVFVVFVVRISLFVGRCVLFVVGCSSVVVLVRWLLLYFDC